MIIVTIYEEYCYKITTVKYEMLQKIFIRVRTCDESRSPPFRHYFDSEGLYGTDGCAYCCIQLEYFIIWIVYY